ncbi:MAG: AraC family transcriptional regulator [Haliscomenobacter sp.]|nr:AraC family transcriptional regulator [Haliscomenobacter sp.]
MRPKLELLASPHPDKSFLCYPVQVPRFEFYWHYHPEFELTWIEQGHGKRFVGDSVQPFTPGDLVLIGPNLPHTWVSDAHAREGCLAWVVQFSPSWLAPLSSYPEMAHILKMLDLAGHGLSFAEKQNPPIIELIQALAKYEGAAALSRWIDLLDGLSRQRNQKLTSEQYFPGTAREQSERRLPVIIEYIQKSFQGSIQIQEAAQQLHLSESAFCKFFKRATGKRFTDYVNEVRIAHACVLLKETDWPISEIAEASGFENLAYFNRIFLKKKAIQPLRYRKKWTTSKDY